MREPIISRTINVTKLTVLSVDLVTKELVHEEVTLPRKYNTDADALSKAQKLFDTVEKHIVAVEKREEVSQLIGMTEAEFIKLAKPVINGKIVSEDIETSLIDEQ